MLPDNSTTTYLYQGNTVKVTDPAGKWKLFTMDAFGNLTTVQESDPSLGNVTTTYTYDVLSHLTGVSMPRGTTTQTRTFNYNSGTTVTGFLQSATNPENGTVNYFYSGNILTGKGYANHSQPDLTYQYDQYHRLTSVTWASYPGGGQVVRTYSYDTNPLDSTHQFSQNASGRLTAIQYGPSSSSLLNEQYSYSQAGLPTTKRVQINEKIAYVDQNNFHQNTTLTANLDSTLSYTNEGNVYSITYPGNVNLNTPTAGPGYTYTFDQMSRLNGATDQNSNTIVSGVSYNPASQMLGITYNGIAETRTYNSLNQLTNITAAASGENLTYNYPSGTNNGKVSSMYNAISGETVTYTYDSLNRLATAAGGGWGESYGFDPFGNLLSKTVTSGSGPSLSQAVNANNQIVGQSYDVNGNSTTVTNGGQTYSLTYDIENRLSTVSLGSQVTQYAYDAQNRRNWTWTGATDQFGNMNNYAVTIYSPSGHRLASYNIATQFIGTAPTPALQVTLTTSDTYFGGRRLGSVDQLGSAGTYFPWGEKKGGTNPQDTWSYATYWRDSVSGLDYAHNRYYSNNYGRFMTADPYGASAKPNAPQSWNLYIYATGDPTNGIDPSGTDGEGDDGGYGLDDPNTGAGGCTTAWESDAALAGSPCGYMVQAPGPYGGSISININVGSIISSTVAALAAQAYSAAAAAASGSQSSNKLPCNPLTTASNLDYSQLLYKKGTQSSKDHIIERHMNGTTSGTSQYYTTYFQIVQLLNIDTVLGTLLGGTETYDATNNTIVFQYSYSDTTNLLGLPVTIGIGKTKDGQPTSTNRLVLKTDCKTVVTSYPVP